MKNRNYDGVIIGGGISGYEVAKYLARAGKSVALVEKEKLGGTAIRWGALPIKKILDSVKNINNDDLTTRKSVSEKLILEWDEDLNSLDNKIKRDLLDLGIDLYFGDGEFLNSKTFKLEDDLLEGEYFIIATGTEADSIKDIPIDGKSIITHKQAINLKDLPKDIVILGGNVEGVEIAAAYAELGVNVILVEKEDRILFDNDEDLVKDIELHLESRNVKIIKGLGAKRVEIEENRVRVILDNDEMVVGEKALVTFKRKANFPRGIENTNIKLDENKIVVDENLLTHEENIFAIGDINGILGMAHVGIQQGMAVGQYILNEKPIEIDYDILPRAIFTLPEMAGLGKQEWELKNSAIPYKIGKAFFKDSWRGWSKGIEEGFVKVILDEKDVILGIWMVGENVSEYIGFLGDLIKRESTVDHVLSNLIIHPSLSETIRDAILEGKNGKVIR